jgi:restriction endonuclease Mrr
MAYRYTVQVSHQGLGKFRVISGTDYDLVQAKARAQALEWEKKYEDTVLNEGASKGILVTTSDYGPDSYEFAKGKPLVLLNGANLLNLMEKHGHKAKIDLKEAKTILGEQA